MWGPHNSFSLIPKKPTHTIREERKIKLRDGELDDGSEFFCKKRVRTTDFTVFETCRQHTNSANSLFFAKPFSAGQRSF